MGGWAELPRCGLVQQYHIAKQRLSRYRVSIFINRKSGKTDARSILLSKPLLKLTMTHILTDEGKAHLKEKAEREAVRS